MRCAVTAAAKLNATTTVCSPDVQSDTPNVHYRLGRRRSGTRVHRLEDKDLACATPL